jgi:putative sterol carrier protein
VAEGVPPEYLAEPSRYFLEWIPSLLAQHEQAHGHFGKLEAVAQFHLTGERGGWWYFELGGGRVHVGEGRHAKPSFTLTMDVDVWRRINRGELNGLRAYLRRDLQLEGSRWKLWRVARLFG